jgi:1-acyl-sn-glycerol-3-phosphate acyltransferase
LAQGTRLLFRSLALIAHLLLGAVLALTLRLFGDDRWHTRPVGAKIIVGWIRALNRIIGLRIKAHGEAAGGMLVANHISWLDIVALGARRHTHFVSKDDVRDWPLIGLLARLSGTLFIRRNSPAALKGSLEHIAKLLASGQSVALFPEGTTTNGANVLPFRPALMQAAVGGSVQPVAIRYIRNGALDTAAPFIGDDEFVPHLLNLLREPETYVELYYLPPLEQHELSRAELALHCQHAIQTILGTVNLEMTTDSASYAVYPTNTEQTLATQDV